MADNIDPKLLGKALLDPEYWKSIPGKAGEIASDAILGLHRADGAYLPIFNTSIYRSDTPADGWVGGQNVRAHEEEHRRQFNYPGDYSSEKAMRIAERIAPELKTIGYSRADMPMEAMAYMAGSQEDYSNPDTYDPKVYTDYKFGTTKPHPAWNQLDEEAKQWYMQNQLGKYTNENYLGNVDTYGETIASAIERAKHLGQNMLNPAEAGVRALLKKFISNGS